MPLPTLSSKIARLPHEHPHRVRVSMRLNARHFATLIGVSVSTVYRWEALDNPQIDPRSQLLLWWAAKRLEASDAYAWSRRVYEGVRFHGGLVGLARFLDGVDPERNSHTQQDAGAGTRSRSHMQRARAPRSSLGGAGRGRTR